MSDRRSDDRRRDRHYSSRRERSRSPDDRRRDRDERSSRRYEDDRRSSRHEEDRDRRGYSERRREEPRTEEARLNEGKKGLNIEIHPLLSKEVDVTNVKSQAVSFIPKSSIATVKANQRMAEAISAKLQKQKEKIPVNSLLAIQPEDITKNNPYFDRRIGIKGNDHSSRPLHFNQRGKFIAKASKVRNEAQMKILEREIAESSGVADLDVDIISDLLRLSADQVPQADWWDLPFLPSGSCADLKLGKVDYSKINSLIHRPALIQPPADPNVYVAPKPLALTKEEQKKIRRQRRLEEQKDKQERIKLGLLPPDAPKVKIANLMNVLASESVQEPSKIEAQVRQQAAERKQAHEEANQGRKLTEEERSERNRQKMVEDTSHLVHVALYFVKRLERPQWRFKVSMNAQQNHLTGCALMTPDASLVVVEGGPKGLKKYNNLMLRRINWQEEELLPEESAKELEGQETEQPVMPEMIPEKSSPGNQDNECRLLWEGTVAKASWRWFEMKPVTTQYDAKQYLCDLGLDSYWNLLKSCMK